MKHRSRFLMLRIALLPGLGIFALACSADESFEFPEMDSGATPEGGADATLPDSAIADGGADATIDTNDASDASTDDASADDASDADAGPPPGVIVTRTEEGPVAGVPIVFSDATGAVLGTATTNV